jgi:hypothetical protein
MFRFSVMLAVLSALCGCASTFGTIFNRPVVEDGIKDVASTISLAADRRTVVVVTDGANKSRFCAEPPPDTATGLKTELEASLEGKVKDQGELKAGLKDKLETNVTVIAERTAALDAFRAGVYALCQYHLNGAVAQNDVKTLFESLIAAFSKAHAESAQSRIAVSAASAAVVDRAAKLAPVDQ